MISALSSNHRRWTAAAIVLVAAAFAIRAGQFGNPLIEVDENFYLLVGDRMLHGALPYVDIWDRKPIGLFLIFAGVRLLGGVGIVQYQVVATLFAAGTAIVVSRIAARIAPLPAAVAAGVLYLLMLGLAGGGGGQSPVFYNLFVAGAALATLRAVMLDTPAAEGVRGLGVVAMLLTGIAMQIKYNALFEGVFFGIVLLATARRQRAAIGGLAADAGVWIGAALLPTLLALAWYGWIGQADAFVYANFLSIGSRSGTDAHELLSRLAKTGIVLVLPIICVLLSILLEPWRRAPGGPAAFRFVMAWLGAALFGYFLFGTYFDHYALPLMVPIAVGCAPLFGYRPSHIGPAIAGFMLLTGSIAYAAVAHRILVKRGGAKAVQAMLAAIEPRLGRGLYIYDGDTIIYFLTRAPLLTRWPFPTHIGLQREAGAIGVDPLVELRHILARKPGLIVDTVNRHEDEESVAANTIVRHTLARDYRSVARVPARAGTTIIYERVDGR